MTKPTAVVLVRNTAAHDARVLRAARTLAADGYEAVVLAVTSTEERSRTARQGDVDIVRLSPRSPFEPLRRLLGSRSASPDRDGREEATAVEESAEPLFEPASEATPGPLIGLHRLLRTLSYYRRGIALLRKWKPAIVHCNDYNTMWSGIAARLLVGSALVYDSHELWPDRNGRREPRWWLRLCEALFVRVADQVVTTSPGHADVMADRYSIPKPTVIRNLSEASPAAESGAPGQSLSSADDGLAVYVGAVTRGRGLEPAIEALGHLDRVRLRVIGQGNDAYREALLAHARRVGVVERLELVGPVAPARVVSTIRGAGAGLALIEPICLSYRLCLPNKLFEYVAAGLPVLGSDLPVIGDFVRSRGVGLLVPPDDPVEVAAGLDRLLGEDGDGYGAAARRAATELQWEPESRLLSSVYRDAVASAGRSPVAPTAS